MKDLLYLCQSTWGTTCNSDSDLVENRCDDNDSH